MARRLPGGYRRTSSSVANCGGVVTAALRAAFPTAGGLPLVVGSAAGSETWSNDDLSPQAHLLRFIDDASTPLPEQPRPDAVFLVKTFGLVLYGG